MGVGVDKEKGPASKQFWAMFRGENDCKGSHPFCYVAKSSFLALMTFWSGYPNY